MVQFSEKRGLSAVKINFNGRTSGKIAVPVAILLQHQGTLNI